MRITYKQVEAKVARIAHKSCQKMRLASQSQMPGTIYRLENESGSRNISPLLSPKEMIAFLEGYEKALEELQYRTQDEIVATQIDCGAAVIGALFCPCPACAEVREGMRK